MWCGFHHKVELVSLVFSPGESPDRVRELHFHILLLDGAYVYRDNWPPQFQRVRAPDKSELEDLVHLISQRAGRCLERLGLLEQDAESAWLGLEPEPAEDTDALPNIMGSSISSATAPALLHLLHPCSRIGLLWAHSKAKKRS
jgi:hypothetical protein